MYKCEHTWSIFKCYFETILCCAEKQGQSNFKRKHNTIVNSLKTNIRSENRTNSQK